MFLKEYSKLSAIVLENEENHPKQKSLGWFWYARLDSNQRPSESESDTLSN